MPHKEPDKVICILEIQKGKSTFLKGEEYDSFPTRGDKGIFYWVGINHEWLIYLNKEEFEEHFETKKESVPT